MSELYDVLCGFELFQIFEHEIANIKVDFNREI